MATAAAASPVATPDIRRRLASIDILRGLIMILMALDHVRDYFTYLPPSLDLTSPTQSWPALFFTRWITHLCAPGFVALAGTSVYLQRQRGRTAAQVSRHLLARGLWLIFLEITVISFGWSFNLAPILLVIWAIGASMIFLACLQFLPTAAIGTIGALIVCGHDLFDTAAAGGDIMKTHGVLETLLHRQGLLVVHGQVVGVLGYPLVPWIGVICIGYAFGALVVSEPGRRRRSSLLLGATFVLLFAALRLTHGYGDPIRFEHLDTPAQTVMSFLQVTKYPPSLEYLLATFGILLPLYAFIDWTTARGRLSKLNGLFEIYGRVPLFYYVLHIYLAHGLALLLTAAQHKDWRFWLKPGAVFAYHLPGWGFGLPGVYLVWITVVLALYVPCAAFGKFKARRRDWWLSYL